MHIVTISAAVEVDNVMLSVLSESELQVQWDAPTPSGVTSSSDEVHSYRIEWDSNPGTREIQVIKSSVDASAHEIQAITTTADHLDEVQGNLKP